MLQAALRGDLAKLERQLARGVDANTLDPIMGEGAMHWASRAGTADIVAALLRSGADPSVKTRRTGKGGGAAGRTPLDFAVEAGHAAVAEMLKAKGGVAGTVSAAPTPPASPGAPAARAAAREASPFRFASLAVAAAPAPAAAAAAAAATKPAAAPSAPSTPQRISSPFSSSTRSMGAAATPGSPSATTPSRR